METSKEAKDAIGKVPVLSGKRCRQGERMDVILDRVGMGKNSRKKEKSESFDLCQCVQRWNSLKVILILEINPDSVMNPISINPKF